MDDVRTCTLCGARFGPLTGHDLGVEGFVCSRCYVAGSSSPGLPERLRERERLRAQRRVWFALAAFWAVCALAALAVWRGCSSAPDASEIGASEAWDDEPRPEVDR